MNFFQSEVVQKELHDMQELYMDINRMGLMLNVEQKRDQLTKMLRLIELQQTMYMRVILSEDPDAKQLVDQVKNAAQMLGMPPDEIGPQFYEKLKENVYNMIDSLPQD
tara:strand:- start:1177 stop:1500 length:324 start_codon:yes stop_codon:yes gene_type:complete